MSSENAVGTGVIRGLVIVCFLSLLAACAGQPDSATGNLGGVEGAPIDPERLSAAISAMGIEELPPSGSAPEAELPEGIVAGGMGLSSPSGFRFRRGQGEEGSATLELISGRRGITGAASVVRGVGKRELYIKTVAATIIRRQESPRFFLVGDDDSAIVFLYESDSGLELLGIAEFRSYLGVLAWSFSKSGSDLEAGEGEEFLAMLRSIEPAPEEQYTRSQRGFGARVATELDSLRWVADVDGGGMVVEDPEANSLAIISNVDPRFLPDFAGFRFTEGDFAGAPSVGGLPEAEGTYWLGSRYFLYQYAEDPAVWITMSEEGLSQGGISEVQAIATLLQSEEERPVSAEEVSGDGRILLVPFYTAGTSVQAVTISDLLTRSVDTAVRVATPLLPVDARALAPRPLPRGEGDLAEELDRRGARADARWVLSGEVTVPAAGGLPEVRAVLHDRAEGQNRLVTEAQLESLFDIFPLIDEVSGAMVEQLAGNVVSFAELQVSVPAWAENVWLEIDDRQLPIGRLALDRIPAGSYTVRVLQRRGPRIVTFFDEEITLDTGETQRLDVAVPERTEDEATRLEAARGVMEAARANGDSSAHARGLLDFIGAVGSLPLGVDGREAILVAAPAPPGEEQMIVAPRLRTLQERREFSGIPELGAGSNLAAQAKVFSSPDYWGTAIPSVPASFFTLDGDDQEWLYLPEKPATALGESFWGQNSTMEFVKVAATEDHLVIGVFFRGRVPRSGSWQFRFREDYARGIVFLIRGTGETRPQEYWRPRDLSGGWNYEPATDGPVAEAAFGQILEVRVPRSIAAQGELIIWYDGGSLELRSATGIASLSP